MSNNNTTPFKDAPPACQVHFPSSETIDEQVNLLVFDLIQYRSSQHSRETLDDIISDLIQYRSSIATADEYLYNNWL